MVGHHLDTVKPTLVPNHKTFSTHPEANVDEHDLIRHGSDTSDQGFEFHPRSTSSTFFIDCSEIDDDHIELGMWSPINAKFFTTEIMKEECRNPQLHHETIPIFLPGSPPPPLPLALLIFSSSSSSSLPDSVSDEPYIVVNIAAER